MAQFEFNANNSGGGWWLKDKDWLALEKAGWHVMWGGLYFCDSKYSFNKPPVGRPKPCADGDKCPGHRKYDSAAESENDRWLGALAREATKEFATLREAVEEWERVTGQDFFAEGCNCCGSPFSMSAKDGTAYMSGDSVERTTVRPW